MSGNFKPEYVTPKTITTYSGGLISIAGSYRLAASGQLPRFKMGRRTAYRTADVDALLAKLLGVTPDREGKTTPPASTAKRRTADS